MGHPFTVDVTSPFGAEGLSAIVHLADGTTCEIPLRDGFAELDLPAEPRELRLDASPGRAPAAPPTSPREAPDDAQPTEVAKVFGQFIPVSGRRVVLRLTWTGHCHGEQHHLDKQGKFNSWEHVQCAWYVGRVAADAGAPEIEGAPVSIAYDTPLPLNDATATFGEVICLAGDYFAHLDAESERLFADAWPPLEGLAGWLAGSDYRAARLAEQPGEDVRALLEVIHARGGEQRSLAGEFAAGTADAATHAYPLRRYLALASQNYCHFGSPDPERVPDEALRLYRGYHALALKRAEVAGRAPLSWLGAVLTEAFACHFLTDLFASGHMRVPRRALGERFGALRGSLAMSATMHAEDNELGLWCTTRGASAGARDVWRAYGDGRLLAGVSDVHLRRVQEAVRRSVAELFAANAGRELPEAASAESLIPVPLAPGVSPAAVGRVLDAAALAATPTNHWPKYLLLARGHVGERVGAPDVGTYRDLEDAAAALWVAPTGSMSS